MLFWSQVIWRIYEKPTSEILRTNLLGVDEKVIIPGNVGIISGLTIDHYRSLLYWADNYQTSIESADFDGMNRKVILADLIVRQFSTSNILPQHRSIPILYNCFENLICDFIDQTNRIVLLRRLVILESRNERNV